jgi:hypothetical protein
LRSDKLFLFKHIGFIQNISMVLILNEQSKFFLQKSDRLATWHDARKSSFGTAKLSTTLGIAC